MSMLEEYLAFARQYPALFENPPEAGLTIILDVDEIRRVEDEVSQRLAAQGFPAAWAQVGIVYQDQYVMLVRDAVRLLDGTVDTCVRSVSAAVQVPGIFILPVYQGNVLLIRHFRHEARAWRWEIPGGFGMPGMSSEENARRELAEEIGAAIIRLIPLGCVYPDAFSGADSIDLFFAEIGTPGAIESQEGITEAVTLPVQTIEQKIRSHEITDMIVLVAYTRAKLQGLL